MFGTDRREQQTPTDQQSEARGECQITHRPLHVQSRTRERTADPGASGEAIERGAESDRTGQCARPRDEVHRTSA